MNAKLWISGRVCRVLVLDDGKIIDTNDQWSNRASAEMWVYDMYPHAHLKFTHYTDTQAISALDQEWNAAVLGN